MTMKLYYSPVSSYSMKTLMAFHEKGVAFEPTIVNLMDPAARADYAKVYPLGKVPFLRVEDKNLGIAESTTIIEYIDQHFASGTKLIPSDPDAAREVRYRDRFFDLHISEPMAKIFFDSWRPQGQGDAFGVTQAKAKLTTAFKMLDDVMADRTWAAGSELTMADCAAAPALFYCRNVHPFTDLKNVTSYANRLMERPSFQKVVKEAEPILAQLMKG